MLILNGASQVSSKNTRKAIFILAKSTCFLLYMQHFLKLAKTLKIFMRLQTIYKKKKYA